MLSMLNAILRDIGNILSVLVTFLLFLTPILYVNPTTGIFSIVTTYNPLYYLVVVPRDLALTGTTSGWNSFALASALAAGIFVSCLMFFHLTETRVAERV